MQDLFDSRLGVPDAEIYMHVRCFLEHLRKVYPISTGFSNRRLQLQLANKLANVTN